MKWNSRKSICKEITKNAGTLKKFIFQRITFSLMEYESQSILLQHSGF